MLFRSQSGVPFTASTAFRAGDGAGTLGGAGGSPVNRPDLVPGKSNNPVSGTTAGCGYNPSTGKWATDPGGKTHTPDLYFDPCAFTQAAPGVFGTVGRHTLIGPGLVNFDFSLIKNTAITETANLQFRAEFFNILNHPNFDNPVGSGAAGAAQIFDSRNNPTPNRGRILTTNTDPREIQFALKLIF